jgi:exodeoxyribonuclease VII large subunit
VTLPFDFDPKPPPPPPQSKPRVFGVAELGRAIRAALGEKFEDLIWVEGEVSGLRAAGSGHVYFTLKDEMEDAALDVAIYRTSLTARSRALLKDGARVRLLGAPQFWPPRGRLQFVAERVAPAGKGALLEALEKLKEKLANEGIFSEDRKRPIPKEPRIIGVVTSAEGAVIHDICRVAFRRGGANILLSSAVVQGANAAQSIAHALAMISRVRGVDVVIVGRGGGSADDLAAFNEEAVVRAIAACRVPVVSAVGHEVDVTLVDFAADARAATPSQAAEMVVPDRRAQRALIVQMRGRLARTAHGRIAHEKALFSRVLRRFGDPRLSLMSHRQTLDDRRARLIEAGRLLTFRRQQKLTQLGERLARRHPASILAAHRSDVNRSRERIITLARARLAKKRAVFETLVARLDAMSPLKVLARGYAVATGENGAAILRAQDVRVGEQITVRVDEGRFIANVTGTSVGKENPK